MWLDTVFAVAAALAIFKGYQKGLIVALFSAAAFLIGLAAAMKLSAVLAAQLAAELKHNYFWLPFASFIIIMLLTGLLVSKLAALVQRGVETAMLGWINRIAGAALYLVLYATGISLLLFFAAEMHLVKPDSFAASVIYPFIEPLGPIFINSLGAVLPWFKTVFHDLQQFFGKIGQ